MYKIIGADGREYGPVTLDQLRQWVVEGRANPQTRILAVGETEWKSLSAFPEIVAGAAIPPGTVAVAPLNPPLATKKPGKLQAIAIMTLVMGILNILIGCYWLFAGLAAFLVGVVFTIIPASYLILLGILEIVNATKLLPDPIKVTQPPKFVAVMEIIAIVVCNALALVVGILNLVFYNDEEVKRYFAARS